MSLTAPVSFHLDLYRYWLNKRGTRLMPARSEIDPVDIPALLPYLGIAEKQDGEIRYTLVGTAVAQQFGYDFTGKSVGFHISDLPKAVEAMQAIAEYIFAAGRPVFLTGQYETKFGSIHNSSALVLPLSDDGTHVNKLVFSRIARFNSDLKPSRDWLRGAPVKINEVANLGGIADLERRCFAWLATTEPAAQPNKAVGELGNS